MFWPSGCIEEAFQENRTSVLRKNDTDAESPEVRHMLDASEYFPTPSEPSDGNTACALRRKNSACPPSRRVCISQRREDALLSHSRNQRHADRGHGRTAEEENQVMSPNLRELYLANTGTRVLP